MEKQIVDFIKENAIATICCTSQNNTPYCFHCFYAFDEKNYLLFFKSSSQTFHSKLLAENSAVAGSILPGKTDFVKLKGIQFSGSVLYQIPEHIHPETSYHKRFPLALAKRGEVWCIELQKVKMTDNSIVFGKKLHWLKNEMPQHLL